MVSWWHHYPKISSSSQTKKPRGSSLAYSMEGNHHPASSRIMPETKTGQPTWDATSILICPSAGHSPRMCECSSGAEWRKKGPTLWAAASLAIRGRPAGPCPCSGRSAPPPCSRLNCGGDGEMARPRIGRSAESCRHPWTRSRDLDMCGCASLGDYHGICANPTPSET